MSKKIFKWLKPNIHRNGDGSQEPPHQHQVDDVDSQSQVRSRSDNKSSADSDYHDNSLFSGNYSKHTGATSAIDSSISHKQKSPLTSAEALRVYDRHQLLEELTDAQPPQPDPVWAASTTDTGPWAPTLPVPLLGGEAALEPPKREKLSFEEQSETVAIADKPRLGPRIASQSASESHADTRKSALTLEQLENRLQVLCESCDASNTSRNSGLVAQLLNDYSAKSESSPLSLDKNEALVRIVGTCLYFNDILFRPNTSKPARMNLLAALASFGAKLGLLDKMHNSEIPHVRNYAIGTSPVLYETECRGLISSFLEEKETVAAQIKEDGAYIAPVLRGLGPRFAVTTLCFGFPQSDESSYEHVVEIRSLCSPIHVYGRSDYIRSCSFPPVHPLSPESSARSIEAPYAVPSDPKQPPMSVSLAIKNARNVSGTLGGYVYPIIPEDDATHAHLKQSTFAMTCGHVCYNDCEMGNVVPINTPVVFPSPVLKRLFIEALLKERNSHSAQKLEYHVYNQAVRQVQNQTDHELGSFIWGERAMHDGMLSDLAIIKCDPKLVCRNFLGNDVNFSQFDPGLMFGNLLVSHIESKPRPGTRVFKYGSTSKYTEGVASSVRMIYCSNGAVQSSEFVIRGETPIFATGGDSGAWVLTKGSSGLGAVGMLHSYDGEFKEMGLYTPMERILLRLEAVTSVRWGLVGVPSAEDSYSEED